MFSFEFHLSYACEYSSPAKMRSPIEIRVLAYKYSHVSQFLIVTVCSLSVSYSYRLMRTAYTSNIAILLFLLIQFENVQAYRSLGRVLCCLLQ